MWKNLINMFRQNNLYAQALQESYTMLDLDLQMFEASIESLRNSDTAGIPIDIPAMDKQINAYERDVRKKVLTHLAISGAKDLAGGMVLVSVVIDIERIGDYAKNIHDLARHHPARLRAGSLEPQVSEIESRVRGLFKDAVAAFKASDVEKCREIMLGYKADVSAASEEIVARIVSGQVTGLSPADATTVALYVRYLKRIGAHSRNLTSSVVNPFPRIGYKEKNEER